MPPVLSPVVIQESGRQANAVSEVQKSLLGQEKDRAMNAWISEKRTCLGSYATQQEAEAALVSKLREMGI